MRNLTASGFYTDAMKRKDIGYIGNQPNQWLMCPKMCRNNTVVFHLMSDAKKTAL
jgi:hypothetical protein